MKWKKLTPESKATIDRTYSVLVQTLDSEGLTDCHTAFCTPEKGFRYALTLEPITHTVTHWCEITEPGAE